MTSLSKCLKKPISCSLIYATCCHFKELLWHKWSKVQVLGSEALILKTLLKCQVELPVVTVPGKNCIKKHNYDRCEGKERG